MAGLAARAKERQDALAADWYQSTLLRILPREYKPMATSLVESCANYKEHDLNPYEILQALNKIRFPIDDHFRKLQSKNSPAPANVRVKVAQTASSDKSSSKFDDVTLIHCDEASFPSLPVRPDHPVQENSSRSGKNRRTVKSAVKAADPVPDPKAKSCKLCGSHEHDHEDCDIYTEERGALAAYPCKKCHNNLYHFYKHCQLHGKETKN
jgi:hypothetical protein